MASTICGPPQPFVHRRDPDDDRDATVCSLLFCSHARRLCYQLFTGETPMLLFCVHRRDPDYDRDATVCSLLFCSQARRLCYTYGVCLCIG